MFFLVILSAYLSKKGSSIIPGILASIAFSIKIIPGAIIFYFLSLKNYKAVFSFIFGAILFSFIIPVTFYGLDKTIILFNQWKDVLSDTNHFPFYKYTNQSPLIIAYRFMPMTYAKVIHYLFNGFILFNLLKSTYKGNQLTTLALSFILMLSFGPVVWIEYFILLLPVYLIVNYFFTEKLLSKKYIYIWIFKIIFTNLLVKFFVGNDISIKLANYGQHFFGLVITIVIGLYCLKRVETFRPVKN